MLWATVKEIWGSPVIVLVTESFHMDIARLSRSSFLTDPTEMSQKKKILKMATVRTIILEQGTIVLIQWQNRRENRRENRRVHPADGFLAEQLNLSK